MLGGVRCEDDADVSKVRCAAEVQPVREPLDERVLRIGNERK